MDHSSQNEILTLYPFSFIKLNLSGWLNTFLIISSFQWSSLSFFAHWDDIFFRGSLLFPGSYFSSAFFWVWNEKWWENLWNQVRLGEFFIFANSLILWILTLSFWWLPKTIYSILDKLKPSRISNLCPIFLSFLPAENIEFQECDSWISFFTHPFPLSRSCYDIHNTGSPFFLPIF